MYLSVFCILIGQTSAGFRASGWIWNASWRAVGRAGGRAVVCFIMLCVSSRCVFHRSVSHSFFHYLIVLDRRV